MTLRKWILFGALAMVTLFVSGCSLTPHANVGINFTMSDGQLRARPNANVGVYASP